LSDLSFFNPLYLWSLFFLLVPLIIHFLNRKRTIKLDFSSLRFLQKGAIKSSRIRHWKKILLLITRLLLITTIILLFTQPYNKKDPFRIISSNNTALFCWIDPTISMDYKRGGISLWQEACDMAAVFDSILPSGARHYCYDERTDNFTDIRREKLPGKISGGTTPLRHGMTDLDNMLQTFQDHKGKASHTPVLVLFSDFQRKDSAAIHNFLNSKSIVFPILCVSLQDEHPWNYSITSTHITPDNNPVLKCKVRASGKKLASAELVALIESMRVGHHTIDLNKHDSLTASFDITHHNNKNWGQVRLMADDPCAFDNNSFFIEKTYGKKKVLIISEGDESFPVTAALRTLSKSILFPPQTKHPMDITYDNLDSSDIILLSNVHEPTSILSALWSKNALSDKVILFSPDVSKKLGSLNSIIFNHLKAKPVNKIIQATKPFYPVLPDTVSSVWRGFPRFTDKDVAVYNYYSHIPGNALLRLNNGTSLISHCIDAGNLSWIVFSTPLHITEANNLCETGFFLPLLDRVINYGIKSMKTAQDNWIAGHKKNNPYSGNRMSAKVFNSDNKQVAQWGKQVQVFLENPGIYKIVPEGEPAYWIAVNADPSEGDLHYKTPEPAKHNKKFIKVINRSSFDSFIKHHKSPGFDFLWIVLALLLLIEVFLWKRNYPT
jgi:hypothetical protein